MAVNIPYISDFLNTPGVEGPRQIRGYVPCRPKNFTGPPQNPMMFDAIGVSGVTIATGCDLGQTGADVMRGYGLSEAIVNCLRPYFGLKQREAIEKLAVLPLTVSTAVAEEIDHAVHAGYLRGVESAYNSESKTPFADLPKQAQAVIFSLCFNYGCAGFRRRAPNTWKALVNGDWKEAATRLRSRDFWTEEWSKNRRGIEGRLLQEVC